MFKPIAWASVSLTMVGCGGSGGQASNSDASTGAITVVHRSGLPKIVREATPEEERDALDALAATPADDVPEDPSEGNDLQLLSLSGITVWGEHGSPLSTSFHQDYCQFPNDTSNKCGIPRDKITKYHWSGSTTSSDPVVSGINFKTMMQQAIGGLGCDNLAWSCTEGGSGSAEAMLLGNDSTPSMCDPNSGACALAITAITYTGSGQCDNIGGITHCYLWQNKCKTTMNVDALHRALNGVPLASKQQMIKHIMAHEMGHCMGFDDFEDAANFTGNDQLMWWSSPPWQAMTFNVNESNSLFFFQPGH